MIASRFSALQPPPKPSAVSARPSSCKAPVTAMLAATANRAAITGPQMAPASSSTTADAAPMPIPTAGKYFTQRDSQSGALAASDDGTGTMVMNRSAFRNSSLPLISDISSQHVAKIGDIRQEPCRGTHQRHREQGTGAFTGPEAEIEQRLGLEGGEYHVMALLRGAMGENTIIARCGTKPYRQQYCGAGNKSVDQYGPALRRRAQHGAGHHRDFQPAEFTEHVEWCGGVAAGRRLFDRRAFAGHAGVVLTCADADAILKSCRREAMGQQRRGGGVADSHFA